MTLRIEERDVDTALDAFAELPEWLAAVMQPVRVAESLRRAVPELADLASVEVDRLRAKGSEWHVRCLVERGDADRSQLVLVGRLLPPGSEPLPDASAARFGNPGWRCFLHDLRLVLEVEPADPGLPALPSLVDAGRAAEVLQRSLRDAGHDVEVAGCAPDVVRYKPGSRCTIVYRMDYGAGARGPDPLVVKTHHGDKGATAWEAMRALWESPVATEGVVTLAEPLAYLPEERVLVQGPVPEERTLKDLAVDALGESGTAADLEELRATLTRTATALARLHGSGARYGHVATWHDELADLREVVARLALTVPHLGTAADPLLGRLEAVAAAVPADPVVPAHHDFRPAQVLLHQGRIGFIDFDGACQAEPALDLGRFRSKLRDIGVMAHVASGHPLAGEPFRRHLRLVDGLCDEFLAAYQRAAPVTAARVALWESTDLLTALLHAWTKVRTARVRPRLAVLRHVVSNLPTPAPDLSLS